MLKVGLTGGLASGKSTVAAFFREHGAYHLDADRIAHELMAPGGATHAAIAARFGDGVVGTGGAIDRGALARIVFDDPRALADLNGIVHPRVREEIARRIEEHAASSDPASVALVDAALLVESGIHRTLDALVVVACSPRVQIERAVARGGLSESEARARVAAQAPLDVKRAVADYVIDNDGALDATRRQVDRIWGELTARAGS